MSEKKQNKSSSKLNIFLCVLILAAAIVIAVTAGQQKALNDQKAVIAGEQATVQQDAETATADKAAAEAALTEAQTQLADAQTQLETAQAANTAAEASQTEAEAAKASAQAEIDAANAAGTAAGESAAALQTEIESLTADAADLEADIQLRTEVAALQEQSAALETETAALTERQVAAQNVELAKVAELSEQADALTTEVAALKETAVALEQQEVLAEVNGQPITQADIESVQNNISYYYETQGIDVKNPEYAAVIRAIALQNVIESRVIAAKAESLGIKMTDEEEAALRESKAEEWKALVEQFVDQAGADPAIQETVDTARMMILNDLASMGYDDQTYVETALTNEMSARAQKLIIADIEVTDEEIQAHFDELVERDRAAYEGNIAQYEYMTNYYNQPAYYMPEGYRGVTQILLAVDTALMDDYNAKVAALAAQEAAQAEATETDLAPEATVTEADVEAARQAIMDSVKDKIDDIYARIANGEDFLTLIDEYNIDPGMQQEENRTNGYSVHKESIMYDPPFTAAAASVENIGDVAQPAIGKYGIYIVKYQRDIPGGAVELTDAMKDSFRSEMLAAKRNDAMVKAMNEWTEEVGVNYVGKGQELAALLTAN